MKKLALLLVGLSGCILIPYQDIRWQGMHAGHRVYQVSCQTNLSTCMQTTEWMVAEKCQAPIGSWRVVLASESFGASQYWVECQ